MKINADMTIKEILDLKPDACKILMDYGLGCAHCELGQLETLKEGCKGHGLTHDEIEIIINWINKK